MTRVDLKGERPDDATETRGMAEQASRDADEKHVDVTNRTFIVLLVILVAVFGGLAILLRL